MRCCTGAALVPKGDLVQSRDGGIAGDIPQNQPGAPPSVDVEDAPACNDAGDLEEGCYYDLLFGRGAHRPP